MVSCKFTNLKILLLPEEDFFVILKGMFTEEGDYETVIGDSLL
jgi:hypothetical protein